MRHLPSPSLEMDIAKAIADPQGRIQGGIAQKCSGDVTIPEETKWQTKLVGFTLCFGTDLSPLRPQRKTSQQGVHSGDADPDDLEISANHDRMEGSIEHSVSVSEDDRGTLRCHRLRFEGP